MEQGRYLWESHPFRKYPSQQFALVEVFSWYDPSALGDFEDIIAEVYGENPETNEHFIAAVQKQARAQIATVNALAAERGIIVPDW